MRLQWCWSLNCGRSSFLLGASVWSRQVLCETRDVGKGDKGLKREEQKGNAPLAVPTRRAPLVSGEGIPRGRTPSWPPRSPPGRVLRESQRSSEPSKRAPPPPLEAIRPRWVGGLLGNDPLAVKGNDPLAVVVSEEYERSGCTYEVVRARLCETRMQQPSDVLDVI
ncbi:hypothetical protein T484DRAFT_2898471 [Baffinella frigidus]|nr:hypothetical protein T484DRAFT_2898471 [Cryptophyta sp. CCMP2293]